MELREERIERSLEKISDSARKIADLAQDFYVNSMPVIRSLGITIKAAEDFFIDLRAEAQDYIKQERKRRGS